MDYEDLIYVGIAVVLWLGFVTALLLGARIRLAKLECGHNIDTLTAAECMRDLSERIDTLSECRAEDTMRNHSVTMPALRGVHYGRGE